MAYKRGCACRSTSSSPDPIRSNGRDAGVRTSATATDGKQAAREQQVLYPKTLNPKHAAMLPPCHISHSCAL